MSRRSKAAKLPTRIARASRLQETSWKRAPRLACDWPTRLRLFLVLCFAWASPVLAETTSDSIFADDFSEPEADGTPNLEIWGNSPRNEDPPAQSIRVIDTDTADFFAEDGPYLHLYADGSNGDSIWLTANRKFSQPAQIVTVAFDFYYPGGGDDGPRIRLGDQESIFNANRVRQDIQFDSQGGLSGAPGIFQTGREHHVRFIYNNSVEALENYAGEATLESDAYDVWVDGQRVLANHRWNTHSGGLPLGTEIRSLTFGAFGSDANELLVRNLAVYPGAVPGEAYEPPPADDGVQRFYLSPTGDDANHGRDRENAILTLDRVHSLLQGSQPQRNVEILIEPGDYYGQTISWTYTHPDHSIVFKPVSRDAAMPVFDGAVPDGEGGFDYPGGTWFRLAHSQGERTNLEFRRLRIQNYQDAISLNGNRNDPMAFNSHNAVRECYFYRIGNVFNPQLSPSTAVIRFVNSQDNVVENNDFVDVINTTSGALIHANYIAHLSDGNRIHRNRFVNHSGDPIRIRDFSNQNDIRDNVFIRAGTGAGYTEWYCDQDARDDCTKAEPECPSWENEFRENFLVSKYNGEFLPTFRFFQDDSTTGCSPLFDGAVRLHTSGNARRDSLSPYALWQHRYFEPGRRGDERVAGPDASPAGDGFHNIVKYALGLDPRRSVPPELRPAVRPTEDGGLAFTYTENPDSEGVEIVVETSTDLVNWHSDDPSLGEARTFQENGRQTREVPVSADAPGVPRRFIRLSVHWEK